MVDAVKATAYVFGGTFQYNLEVLNDVFLRRLIDPTAEVVARLGRVVMGVEVDARM